MKTKHTIWSRLAITIFFVSFLITLLSLFFVQRFLTKENDEKELESTSDVLVLITKDGFVPETVQVTKDTRVTWKNDDSVSHQVSAVDLSAFPDFKSSNLGRGENFTITFQATGTFPYHDPQTKETFKGTVVVGSPPK